MQGLEAVWGNIKDTLKTQLSPSGYHLWIDPLQIQVDFAEELVLACPNPFALRWVQAHYVSLIRQALKNSAGLALPVRLALAQSAPPRPALVARIEQPRLLPPPVTKNGGRRLNQAFTFDQFVVGPGNRLAYQACQALAQDDTFYNRILFVTGGTGLGKSHLSQAVGNHLCGAAIPGKVLYLTAEDFANEMVTALKGGQMDRFKQRFRGDCEALLLEEVQFLSGKDKIQAELCYTLDTLAGLGKRLIFTSAYLPVEISQLSRQLRSRLSGGLITPIDPPDFSTRVKILTKKSTNRGIQVSVKVLEYLAEHIDQDVRRLESSLDCLIARGTLLKQPMSQRLAREVLQDLKGTPPALTVPEIQGIVCDYYQISLKEMLDRSRRKRLVRARQLALYFSRLYTQKTLVDLGRLFQRSHASVTHALQTLERDRRTQPRLAQEVQFLEEKLAAAQVRSREGLTSTPHTGV